MKFRKVISRFALNHEETVARRLLMSKKSVEEVPANLMTISFVVNSLDET